MSQDQQAMTGNSPADSLAADMPSVPGAGTAKSIIEDAIHPHQQAASVSTATVAGASPVAGSVATTGALAAPQAAPADAFVDQVFDVPIMGETLTFGKRAVVTEELRVSKRAFSQEERVTDTVRRERVSVEGADVVEGADDQLGRIDTRGPAGQERQGGAQEALQEGAQNVQEGAGEAKHGLDGMIDSAVDRLFGGHRQQGQ